MSGGPSGTVATANETPTSISSHEDLKRVQPHRLDKQQLRGLFQAFYEDDNENENTLLKGDARTEGTFAERKAAAYVTMSSLVQSVRGKPPSSGELDEETVVKGTKRLTALLQDLVLDGLHSPSAVEQAGALALVSALFDVDSPSAANLIQNATILNAMMELLDASLKKPVDLQTARLLERAMAHPLSRSTVREECDFRAVRWLLSMSGERGSPQRTGKGPEDRPQVKTSAILALVKLSQGSEQDQRSSKYVPSSAAPSLPSPQQLASLLQQVIIDTSTSALTSLVNNDAMSSSILDAVEGLAYLTAYPSIRAQITSSVTLLNSLFEFSAVITKRIKPSSSLSSDRLSQIDAASRLVQTNLAMHYGLALLFANLCKYKPVLSQEEQQIKKLRKMAKPQTSSTPSSKLDSAQVDEGEEDEHTSNSAVLSRTRALTKAGLLPALAGLARSPSASARACVASAYLGVIQDTASRGEVLKAGGGKALLGIVAEDRKSQVQRASNWTALQALAKLAITASPFAVFGPDPGATQDAIGPLASVLTWSLNTFGQTNTKKDPLALGGASDGGPTQLQRFESLMALTNIASLGPDMAKRILKVNGLVREVESLLVEEHVLIRRAAVELMCNLVACEEGFNLFLPDASKGGSRAQSRLHVLVALSDVEDMPTRKAASGALAMLTSEEAVCLGLLRLQKERGSVLGILGRLLLEEVGAEMDNEEKGQDAIRDLGKLMAEMSISDVDLVHRGIVILRNLAVLVIEPQKQGWCDFMSDLGREGIVESVEMVVKDYINQGGEIASGPVVENALEFGLALKRTSDIHGM